MSKHILKEFSEWMKRSGKDITEDVELFLEINRPASSNIIIQIVSEVTGVSVNAIKSRVRKQEYVFARAIICKMFRDFTHLTLKQIGLELGGRDHSTVIHGIEVYEQMYFQSHDFRRMADEVRDRLRLHYLKREINNIEKQTIN